MAINWNFLFGQIGQSRSSALNPLQWVLAIFVGGVVGLATAKAPEWAIIGTGTCAMVDFVALLCAYFYFMWKDRDALRSESFSLQKLAMEKGLLGDNLQGMRPASEIFVANQSDGEAQREQKSS